jgi:hypothetical protein
MQKKALQFVQRDMLEQVSAMIELGSAFISKKHKSKIKS